MTICRLSADDPLIVPFLPPNMHFLVKPNMGMAPKEDITISEDAFYLNSAGIEVLVFYQGEDAVSPQRRDAIARVLALCAHKMWGSHMSCCHTRMPWVGVDHFEGLHGSICNASNP